jgi:threonine dehydrogenase-like Zn-dependent dehydrogenase
MSKLPKTSKAMVLEKFCEPLVMRDIPLPPLAPGDMLTKPVLASVCGTDVHLSRDELSMHPPCPIIMGHETVAEIVYLPDSIKCDVAGTPVKVGDRIMWAHKFCGECYACKVLHEPNMCYKSRGYGFSNAAELRGGYAEYEIVLAGTDFVRVPDSITNAEAVGACCAGRTVVNGFEKLFNCGGIRTGDSVVIEGAGPVGLYSTVMAAQSPASMVIITDISETRLAFAKKWGATHTVNVAEHPDRGERIKYIRDLCGGRGADVVIECSGVPSCFADGLDFLASPSKYLILGQTSTTEVPIVPNKIMDHNAVIIGSRSGDIRHYIKCLKFIEANKNRYPFGDIISREYKLEDANQALADMRSGVALKAALVF